MQKRSPYEIQRAVYMALLLRELKARFGGKLIGLFWLIIEPALAIAMLLIVRVILRERFYGVMYDTAVYIIVAAIPFFLFRNIWFQAMNAVEASQGLFGFRQVKPLDTMLARATTECLLYTGIFMLFISIFWWWGLRVLPERPLEYIGIVSILVVTGFAMALITTVLSHDIPVIKTIVRIATAPLMILSGVIIPVTTFPPYIRQYLMYNPLLHLVELARTAYLTKYHPIGGIEIEYPIEFAITTLFIGAIMYWLRRTELIARA